MIYTQYRKYNIAVNKPIRFGRQKPHSRERNHNHMEEKGMGKDKATSAGREGGREGKAENRLA